MSSESTLVETGSRAEEGNIFEVAAFAGQEVPESPNAEGVDERVSEPATLDVSESPHGEGDPKKGSIFDTFGTEDSTNGTGNDESLAHDFDADERDLFDSSTHLDMHLESEERWAPEVEPTAGLAQRGSRSRSRLRRMGASRIALAAAAVVVVAGTLVYGVGFSGAGHPDPSAAATGDAVASVPSTPEESVPAPADRTEAAPPSEPGVIEMLTAAAEQGDVVAQHDLATRYLEGTADERDLDQAVKWLERAASQGHPQSQHALAVAYAQGRGVKPSDASAVVWLRRAARAGNAESQVLLAERHEAGRGVERSAAKAAELYALAAAKGHDGAADKAKALAALTAAKSPGAKITPPTAKPSPADDTPLDKAGIAEVQRLLTRLAFKPGPADGVLGQRTIGEIKLYQSFAGVPDDGKPTLGLLNELREMVRGLSVEAAGKP